MTVTELPLGSYTQETVAVVAADGGGTIFSGGVAGASIVPKGSGFQFTAVSGSTGITKVRVKPERTAGFFKVTLRTKEAWTPPAADETELTTLVTLNVGGRCFRGNATRVRP